MIYKNVNGNIEEFAQGDNGNLYPYQEVVELYYKSLFESGIYQVDYSLPGG